MKDLKKQEDITLEITVGAGVVSDTTRLIAPKGARLLCVPACKQTNILKGGEIMATWKCECGNTKEGRCKPQKCEKCGEKGKFVKSE